MIEMESLDKDEGYISPLETLESRGVFSRRKRVTSVTSNSWDRASEAGDDFQNDGGNASFVTEIIRNSSAIIDSLWLTLPESQACRMTGITEENNLTFESSTILEVVRSTERVKYISLNEFIRDTVDLLCGKQSHTYILKGGTDFQKQPAVLIHGLTPSAVACYSAQYLPTGSNIVKLSQIDEHFHFQTFVLQSASKVCVSFVKFIKDFLKVYQAIVMLKRGSIKTLTSLRTFFWPYQQQIQTLVNIMEEQVFASPVILLKNLNDFMLKTEVPWVSDMLQNLLISCASAYFWYVSDWIFRGKLHSPLEFHITRNRTAVNQNRKFWTHQFAQNDEIPLFLKKFKNYMFDTGRVVNLMQELETNNLPTCFDHDTDLFIKLKLSHQSVVKLLLAHEAKISAFLHECSYLQAEIEDAVSKTTKMDMQVDQATVDKSASEYLLRHESTKLKRILEEQEIKQTKMTSILQEMEDARYARLRQAMDDLFENKKAKSVAETIEQNQAKREYELTEKYCGQFVSGFSPDEKSSIDILNPIPPTSIPFNHQDFVSLSGQIAEHPIAAVNDNKKNYVSSSQLSIPIEGIPLVGILGGHKETVQVILSRGEIGAGDNNCDSRAETAFPEEIEIDDFQVKSVNPFQLNLEIFEKAFLPCSTSDGGNDSSESPTEECDAFLTNRFLSLSVEIPLMTHHKMVNLALLHHIIVTKQLFRHVKILQDYILLQNGLFGQFLCGKLIERVKSGLLRKKEDIPGQLTALNQCIEEVLQFTADSDEIAFLDRLKFDRIEEDPSPEKFDSPGKAVPAPSRRKKQTITSEYEVLNSICLRYTVDWPLNIFFTEEFFQKYQNVFILQMQLYRSEILLEKTAKILKCKATRSPQLNELLYCRYVMLHFVRSLRSYINVTVIHSSWTELTSSFGKMDSVEKIYELLVHHIKTVISNCLLGPKAKSVMKLITSQLTVIESFCAKIETGASSINWAAGGKIPAKEFKILVQTFKVFQEIEKVFVQAATSVTHKGYYPRVTHFLELLNFNDFYTYPTLS